VTFEIVLLAMVALFVGIRLYAVLGQRTGHEQQPVTRPDASPATDQAVQPQDASPERKEPSGFVYEDAAAGGIRAIIAADPSFDVARFLDGAQSAYRMTLEAFWKGDREELRHLTAPEVFSSFEEAIAERETAGFRLDNRLIQIERTMIEEARLSGRTAEIEVRFDADIAAVTRDASNEVVAGTMSDAVVTRDIWTFRRTLGSSDPNWLLVDTEAV
jgi:predicted lipid-binding transport protein (Tim44 family)